MIFNLGNGQCDKYLFGEAGIVYVVWGNYKYESLKYFNIIQSFHIVQTLLLEPRDTHVYDVTDTNTKGYSFSQSPLSLGYIFTICHKNFARRYPGLTFGWEEFPHWCC